ncbi:Membrane insertion protein OxaA/YidC [Macrophomina phaseolina MS6]|uniref:Membrane insertion protein OxaA/YidC n=1 Tax=Macrophomina phaseolina (strain MS6) TaxID=1126212 RepID=K2SHA5_MACPH|nr:Membrane insertion protein OxaA/YidC [Macrophomina phaseolina MS6]
MFEVLHNCGLSWAVAIPAGAVVVRGLIIMPWFQIPARKAQQQNAALLPLNHAYAIAMKHRCHQIFYDKGPRVARSKAKMAMAKYNYQLRQRWRAERWRQMLPLATFPIFIGVAEVIRRMCGSRSGLWGIIFGSGSAQAQHPSAEALTAAGESAAVEAVDRTADALEAVAQWKGSTALPEAVPDSVPISNWLEPSFATEGALWFPNLMLADPNMILPFVVSGLTMATLHRGSKPPQEGKERPAGIILRRILMTGALAIGPLTLHMPTAILLYWSASTTCAYISHLILDKYYPLDMPPKPCRRSVMYNPKAVQKAK